MQAGQTLRDDAGNQVCLFPLPVLHVTQTSSPSSYSHCCGNPFDCVGSSAAANYYAPCDMRLIYAGPAGNGMPRIWQSQRPVRTPSGVTYVCVEFGHDNNPPYSTIGATVRQGQLIGHTGTAGMVTGDHVHIDQARGQNKTLRDYGIVCAGGNECWALADSIVPTSIFYINGTTIIDSMGLKFSTFDGGGPGPDPPDPPGPVIPEFEPMKFFFMTLKRR